MLVSIPLRMTQPLFHIALAPFTAHFQRTGNLTLFPPSPLTEDRLARGMGALCTELACVSSEALAAGIQQGH